MTVFCSDCFSRADTREFFDIVVDFSQLKKKSLHRHYLILSVPYKLVQITHSAWCCSVAKSYLILCDSMVCSMSDFPVLCCFPEFAQIHVH